MQTLKILPPAEAVVVATPVILSDPIVAME